MGEHLANLFGVHLDTAIVALSTDSLRVGLTQGLFASGEATRTDCAMGALLRLFGRRCCEEFRVDLRGQGSHCHFSAIPLASYFLEMRGCYGRYY